MITPEQHRNHLARIAPKQKEQLHVVVEESLKNSSGRSITIDVTAYQRSVVKEVMDDLHGVGWLVACPTEYTLSVELPRGM